MFYSDNIKILQLEISNYCNAACPQCPRNYFGGKTIATLPLKKWNLIEFKKIFFAELVKNLEQVYFCGTYGDPMTNKHILEMCQFVKNINASIKIGIHTNGGVGAPYTYAQLADCVDFVAFGIDGLEATNEIYRRNVKWNKLMQNAKAYIEAGGYAIWDFIVFKHNEHQLTDAKDYSQQLGFKEFNIKKTGRFFTRDHIITDKLLVNNNDGFIDYTISLPTNQKYINDNYETIEFVKKEHGSLNNYASATSISCNAQRINEVYIGADGFVFPCGWLHDRLYGAEVETHPDHSRIKQLIHDSGGIKNTNIFYSSFKDIINGPWFAQIQQTWTGNRLERCGMMCGKTINLIKSQNEEIEYKL
jgi:MoaA/NifB/PqqE/SkfB family radical SAM enzyme